MEKKELLSSIATRGSGEIYLGVVGAVRTGKSTFIKKMNKGQWFNSPSSTQGNFNILPRGVMRAEKDSIFENPMFIYAPDGKSLAMSSHYPPEINWHWAEILENNGLSEDRMKTLRDQSNLTRVFKDLTPTFHESKIGLTDYIHCSILANHYMAGHFVLFSMHKPLSKEVLPLCSILVSYISKYINSIGLSRCLLDSKYFLI